MADNNHIAELVLTAKLNMVASRSAINKQIRELAKDPKLSKLTIKVDVDKSFVNTMKNFMKSTKGLAEALENQNKVTERTTRTIQKADGSIEKITTTVKANQEVWRQSSEAQAKAADTAVKSTKKQTDAIDNQRTTLKQMKNELQDYQKTSVKVNRNQNGEVSSLTHVYQQKDTGKKLTINTDPTGGINNSSKLTDYLKAQKQQISDYNQVANKNLADEEARASTFRKLAKEKYEDQKRQEQAVKDGLKSESDRVKAFEASAKKEYDAYKNAANTREMVLQEEQKVRKAIAEANKKLIADNIKAEEGRTKAFESNAKKQYDNYVKNFNAQQAEEKRINALREANAREEIAQQQRVAKGISDINAKRRADDIRHGRALEENKRRDVAYADTVSKLSNQIENAKAKFKNNTSLTAGLTQIEDKLKNVQGTFGQRSSMVNALQNEMNQFQVYGNALTKLTNQITRAKKQFKGDGETQRSLAEIQAKMQGLSGSTTLSSTGKINALAGLSSEFDKISASATRAGNGFKVFDRDIVATIGNMARFQVAIMALYMPFQALGSVIKTVLDVDAQMTQLRRVMDDATDFKQIMQDNINIANELGRSINDINEGAIGFARMGFDSEQTEQLTKTAGLLQNISDLKADEAINTLTSAMTVFNIEAGKSIDIADKLNEVDNNFGASRFSITA